MDAELRKLALKLSEVAPGPWKRESIKLVSTGPSEQVELWHSALGYMATITPPDDPLTRKIAHALREIGWDLQNVAGLGYHFKILPLSSQQAFGGPTAMAGPPGIPGPNGTLGPIGVTGIYGGKRA